MATLSLEQANNIINVAIETARAAKAPAITVVVLDDSGNIKAVQREDGASMFRFDISLGKAWGAVAMGESSRSLARRAKDNPVFFSALSDASGGRFLPNPGGVLILSDGAIIGAVGISGDKGAKDEGYAVAGIEAAGLVAESGLE